MIKQIFITIAVATLLSACETTPDSENQGQGSIPATKIAQDDDFEGRQDARFICIGKSGPLTREANAASGFLAFGALGAIAASNDDYNDVAHPVPWTQVCLTRRA